MMKLSRRNLPEVHRQQAEAIVESHVVALFESIPMLCGFCLQHDLQVTDVAVSTWPGYTAGKDLYEHLIDGLSDLIDERPDAVELLRGRTFARTFH